MKTRALLHRSAFRFSLKALLLLVVPISAGMAALRDATDAWVSGTVTITLLAIFAAIVATLYSSPMRRPIWGSFALCCGGYFVLIAVSDESGIVSTLATTKVNEFLLEKLHPNVAAPYNGCKSLVPVVGSSDLGSTSSKWAELRPESDRERTTSTTADFGLLPLASLIGMVDAEAGETPTGGEHKSPTTAAEVKTTDGAVDIQSGADNDVVAEDPEIGDNFRRIAHCLWALVLGGVGAVSVRCFSQRDLPADGGSTCSA